MRDQAQIAVALEAVDAVRRIGVDGLTRNLARRSPDHVIRLAATLAALVPDDQPVSELLEWLHGDEDRASVRNYVPGRDPRLLKPCGTHAAFIRHQNRGEPVDEPCRIAERVYQRSRKRRERAA